MPQPRLRKVPRCPGEARHLASDGVVDLDSRVERLTEVSRLIVGHLEDEVSPFDAHQALIVCHVGTAGFSRSVQGSRRLVPEGTAAAASGGLASERVASRRGPAVAWLEKGPTACDGRTRSARPSGESWTFAATRKLVPTSDLVVTALAWVPAASWFSLSVSTCSTRPEQLARRGACQETLCLPGG
jgi:hypothetical protein